MLIEQREEMWSLKRESSETLVSISHELHHPLEYWEKNQKNKKVAHSLSNWILAFGKYSS
jgi:hypothetical protein